MALDLYSPDTIIFIIFILLYLFVVIFAIFDYRIKRRATTKPFISFIVPTYNDADTIHRAIEGIYSSYDKKRFEILVVNDCSKDNTIEMLKKINKKYPIKVYNNKVNLGKVRSINSVVKYTVGEIVFILDSDTILNRKAIDEMISRLEDKRVGGTACRYRPMNSEFIAKMQGIEYGMLSLNQTAYNWMSTLSLWGGCLAVKKEVLLKVGLFSEDNLTEDMDLAMKMYEIGYKAQECTQSVESYVPDNVKWWYKQKLRWSGGFAQNLIRHYKFYLKNPFVLLYNIIYLALTVLFIIGLFNNLIFVDNMYHYIKGISDASWSVIIGSGFLKIWQSISILKLVGIYLLFPLFSIPYVVVTYPRWRKNFWYFLWLFPYSIIYFPAYTIVGVIGFVKGIHKELTIKKGQRAW